MDHIKSQTWIVSRALREGGGEYVRSINTHTHKIKRKRNDRGTIGGFAKRSCQTANRTHLSKSLCLFDTEEEAIDPSFENRPNCCCVIFALKRKTPSGALE